MCLPGRRPSRNSTRRRFAGVERLTFRNVSTVREIACREFSRIEAVIKGILPDSEIEHVGSTSLPHGITKGDLDIQVSVGAPMFDTAKAALAHEFVLDPDNVWGDGAASFKIEDAAIPIGVHLTEIGGPFDLQWRFRELLKARPELLWEYDDIKRRFEGGRMIDYRNAKAEFFGRIRHLIGPRTDELVAR